MGIQIAQCRYYLQDFRAQSRYYLYTWIPRVRFGVQVFILCYKGAGSLSTVSVAADDVR